MLFNTEDAEGKNDNFFLFSVISVSKKLHRQILLFQLYTSENMKLESFDVILISYKCKKAVPDFSQFKKYIRDGFSASKLVCGFIF
jgi:hypothetical protein